MQGRPDVALKCCGGSPTRGCWCCRWAVGGCAAGPGGAGGALVFGHGCWGSCHPSGSNSQRRGPRSCGMGEMPRKELRRPTGDAAMGICKGVQKRGLLAAGGDRGCRGFGEAELLLVRAGEELLWSWGAGSGQWDVDLCWVARLRHGDVLPWTGSMGGCR